MNVGDLPKEAPSLIIAMNKGTSIGALDVGVTPVAGFPSRRASAETPSDRQECAGSPI